MRLFKKAVIALLAAFSAVVALGLTAAPASAQATRTWVSGVGDDVNPCSRTAPCKTFAGAISKTAAGGEINCLDPAGFGAVTITKSITIDCTGTLGGILASSTTGVIVNGANVIVTLRALQINGGPPTLPGVNGVRFLQGSTLTIEDCTIYNFLSAAPNGYGVIVNPTSGALKLVISNTTINNNGTAVSGGGIGILPTGTASVKVQLQNVESVNNPFNNLLVNTTGNTGGVLTAIVNSQFSGGTHGIHAITPGGAAGQTMTIIDSLIAGNSTTGIRGDGGGAVLLVSGSTITSNQIGVNRVNSGNIFTYGDNVNVGNPGGDGSFNAPPLGKL